MSKILNYLARDDIIVAFDVDGVLCPYEFGDLKHNACRDEEWEDFVVRNKPYNKFKAVPQIKSFIQKKETDRVFVCSVAEPLEEKNKRDFLMREYGIFGQHIKFVRNGKAKFKFLQTLVTAGKNENQIALVENTVSILNEVAEQSNFITVHVSSFFFYKSRIEILVGLSSILTNRKEKLSFVLAFRSVQYQRQYCD